MWGSHLCWPVLGSCVLLSHVDGGREEGGGEGGSGEG